MKVNQIKMGVILSYATMLLGSSISIIYTPIMLRLLGQNEYGLMGLVSSVTGYLGLLHFGLTASYVKYNTKYRVANDKEGENNLNGMYVIVYSFIGVIAFLCGLVLIFNCQNLFGANLTDLELEKAKILMWISVINTSVYFPFTIFSMYVNAREKFVFAKIVSMLNLIANPMVTLPLLLLGFRSVGLTLVTSAFMILNTTASMIYCFKALKFKIWFKRFDLSIMKEIFVFSSFIFLNQIVDVINWSVDKFLLGMFVGTAAIAVYTVGGQFNSYFTTMSLNVSGVLIPRVNRLVLGGGNADEVSKLFIRTGRIQFIIIWMMLSGFILFGQEFIKMWAGQNYAMSYYVALLLLIPFSIPLIQNIGVEIQRAKNMHKMRSIVCLAIAIVNVIISIPLCKAFGAIGSAVGTAIALLLGEGLFVNIYYHKKMNLNMIEFWKNILKLCPAFILPIAGVVVVKQFVSLENVLALVITGLCYVTACGFSIWFFGANQYEKELLSRPVLKLILKIRKKA